MSNITHVLQVIRDKLHQGIELFTDSCFGHFLKLKTISFCSGVVHHMLMRQLTCDDKNVMEFEFNGVGARFDRKAFAMVTGLNCGKFPSFHALSALTDDLWAKYFGEAQGPLTQHEFQKKFEAIKFTYDNADHIADNVKLCMFYFLEMALLPGDKKRVVKDDNLKIIGNAELCATHPWGNLVYDMTIASLRSKIQPGKQVAYTLYGFPLAFQVFNDQCI